MKKEVVYEVRDEVEINYLFIKKGGLQNLQSYM